MKKIEMRVLVNHFPTSPEECRFGREMFVGKNDEVAICCSLQTDTPLCNVKGCKCLQRVKMTAMIEVD